MLLGLSIIQAPLASQPSNLNVLNTLGIAVFSVGILFLLLLSVHYYQRRGMVDRKGRRGSRSKYDDPVMQMAYMNREELKEMILREKAAKEKKETEIRAETSVVSTQPHSPNKSPEPMTLFNLIEQSSPPVLEPEISNVTPVVTGEGSVIANLIVPDNIEEGLESENKEDVPKPTKVIRSALSNELPDEYKGRSRRI